VGLNIVLNAANWANVLYARSIPAAISSAPQKARNQNPFDTPSTQHESLGDNVHVVQ